MKLADQIERDFDPVVQHVLGQLVEVVARSRRNIHPVLGPRGELVGIVRRGNPGRMLDRSRYDTLVRDLMVAAATLDLTAYTDAVMGTPDKTGAEPAGHRERTIRVREPIQPLCAYRARLQEVSEDWTGLTNWYVR